MYIVDLDKIKKALPKRASFKMIRQHGISPAIEVECWPSMSESENDVVFHLFREIIGNNNISEFYTEESGGHFYCYLKNNPFEIISDDQELIDKNTNSMIGINGVVKNGDLV